MAKEERKQFGSSLQFILSCIGYAVGLGNIWRFPMLAYENGGGSFMIPYLTCSFMIGFPMLYLELSLGQYSQSGPATVYGKMRPYAQGLGWGMAITSLLVSIYYNVIVSWVLVFIVTIFMGESRNWALCENYWNDQSLLCIITSKY
uniref:Transporter n=1 Tax=Panagrolaimus davidi TaxID=227884 RepID=A0A914PER7_9BILA